MKSRKAFKDDVVAKFNIILNRDLMELGAKSVILINISGDILTSLNNGEALYDVESLATLAAGNIGALKAMASTINNELPMFIVRGERESIHFSHISKDLLLVSIFGHEISVGYIRIKLASATKAIREIIKSK